VTRETQLVTLRQWSVDLLCDVQTGSLSSCLPVLGGSGIFGDQFLRPLFLPATGPMFSVL